MTDEIKIQLPVASLNVHFFNPEQLAKIKIEDDGSYVQLSEVNKSPIIITLYQK